LADLSEAEKNEPERDAKPEEILRA